MKHEKKKCNSIIYESMNCRNSEAYLTKIRTPPLIRMTDSMDLLDCNIQLVVKTIFPTF